MTSGGLGGCYCEQFLDSVRLRFIRVGEDRFYLADRESGAAGKPGFQRAYGPAIAFCPFCGSRIASVKSDRPAV